MHGTQNYPEGIFAPERGSEKSWHVRCCTGALTVLRRREYETFLIQNPNESYVINFANGSSARIRSPHPLWCELDKIAETHYVDVFRLTTAGGYTPWKNEPSSLRQFDAIRIKAKNEGDTITTFERSDDLLASSRVTHFSAVA